MALPRALSMALLAATILFGAPPLAFARNDAESRPRGIYIPVPQPEQPEGMAFGAGARTILFLNPNGGRYNAGWSDDSTQNVSAILSYDVDIPAYPWGAGSWDTFMTCMRGLYSPFNIEVTDVDPGDAAHMEVVVGGHPNHIGMSQGIGGVAPLTCGVVPNAVAYAFPETYGDDPQGICEAAGQESAHAFGLDHEYLCEDIMTYLYGCGPKTFQDQDVACGEYSERQCYCGGATQNSYQYLMGVLGPAENDAPPTVQITSPADGAGVPPGFTVEAQASDDSGVDRLELYVDGNLVGADDAAPWSFITAADLGAGPHVIEVRAIDDGAHSTADEITVRVDPVEDPGDPAGPDDPADPGVDPGDPDDPGIDPALPGQFGAACDDGTMCDSNACANASSGDGYCTEECDEGACPLGYECQALDVGSYCLFAGGGSPSDGSEVGLGAGCAAAGAGAPTGACSTLLALLGLAIACSRRRR